jgi:hypothetical protein
MARITIWFGVLLGLLGVVSFVATGSQYPTSLIPTAFGILLILFGVLARTENVKKRMMHMHIAVTIGLIGFLATAKSIVDAARLFLGADLPRPPAIQEKAAMSLICLAFVLLSIRSFIEARRARNA